MTRYDMARTDLGYGSDTTEAYEPRWTKHEESDYPVAIYPLYSCKSVSQ